MRSRWRGGRQGGRAKPEMELSTMRPCGFFLRMHQAAKHGLSVGTEMQQGRKKSQNWKLERQFTVDLLISKQAHLGEYDNFERATLESFSEPSGFTDSFGSPVSAKRNLMKFQVCCILFPLISPLPLLRGAERMPAKQINSKS